MQHYAANTIMAKNNSVLKCLYRSEFLKDGVFVEKEET